MGQYKKNSLSLNGAISMGTGVMIGAAIFALVGQVAELSGNYFPLAFLVGAVIAGFSSYAYVKMSNTYPSAGGIGMYLAKAYGKGSVTATSALDQSQVRPFDRDRIHYPDRPDLRRRKTLFIKTVRITFLVEVAALVTQNPSPAMLAFLLIRKGKQYFS